MSSNGEIHVKRIIKTVETSTIDVMDIVRGADYERFAKVESIVIDHGLLYVKERIELYDGDGHPRFGREYIEGLQPVWESSEDIDEDELSVEEADDNAYQIDTSRKPIT